MKPGKTLRILLVEDHGDTRRIMANLLSHIGHELSVADLYSNGAWDCECERV